MADWTFDDITARAADAAVKGQFDSNLKTQSLLNSVKASLSGTTQVLLFRDGVAVTPIPLIGASVIAGNTLTWASRNVSVTFAASHDIDSGTWTGQIRTSNNRVAYAASVGKTTGVIRVSDDIVAGASTVTLGPIVMSAPDLGTGAGSTTDAHYAYPTGFAATVGGRGGAILRVTNLNTSGAGSLKAALDTAGPRIVVFETSGVLDMGGAVWTITEPYLTVAGQTAPAPGFNIIKGAINTKTHDVIIQHLRIRTGSSAGSNVDALEALDGSVNVIFDHNSLSWGTDEILSAGGYPFDGSTVDSFRANSAHRVTFSNNIIAESLTGYSGYGTLMEDNTTENLLYGNLWAHNPERTPNFGGGAQGAVINNVIYNPGGKFIDYTFLNSKWDSEGGGLRVNGKITAIGNVALDGPDSATYGFMTTVSNGDLEYYGSDNIALRSDGTTPVPQTYVSTFLSPTGTIIAQGAPNVMPSGLTPMPSSEVEAFIVANVGARPWDRDSHDQRVIDSLTNRNGSHISNESAVGGYPANVVNTATFNASEWNLTNMTPISTGGGGGSFTPGSPPGSGWSVIIAQTDTPVVVPSNFVGWHRYFNLSPQASPYPYKTHRGHDQRGVTYDVSTFMARLRPDNITWNRQPLDEFIAQTPGKTRVLPLFGTPHFASKYNDTAFSAVKYPSFPDAACAPVAGYVASIVDRIYGAWGYTADDFPFLEVWNEPSFGYSGGQQYLDPVAGQRWTSTNNPLRASPMFFNGDHTDLARIAQEIYENKIPGVTVMGCGFELGLESNGSTRMFNPALFAAAGGMAYIDWFSYHSYIYGYDPSVVTQVRGNIRAWLNSNGYSSMPMANSETGFEQPGPAYAKTDAEIASYAIRMFVRSAVAGDKMFIAYQDRGNQDIYNNPQGPTFKNPTGSATIQAALTTLDALNGRTIRQAQFNSDGRVWVRFSDNTEILG